MFKARRIADINKPGCNIGNPPKNPSVVKVEISMKEFLHEKEQIHRQPNHGCIEAG
jgi:hypothetical protein